MTGRLRVGLLFGGRSVEHEVSVTSARGVAAAMRDCELECIPLAVTGDGRWLACDPSRRVLESGLARADGPPGDDDGGRLVVDPGGSGLLSLRPGQAPEPVELDVLFPLMHGWGGEDGRLQGALDLAGIPCVGAGVLGSALGMDKSVSKQLLAAHGIPVVPWLTVSRRAWHEDRAAVDRQVEREIGYPLFVKPANGGSSVGISKVARADRLAAAVDLALSHDRRALVERAVEAREIECAVIGNERPEASGLGEIVPSGEFYDYAAKYLDGASELKIPAPLDEGRARELRRLALAAFRALDLSGFARVDFLVDRTTDEVFLNEVNTLPGFTPISMFPKLWEAAGVSYPRLIERLVGLALERSRDDADRVTRLTAG